MSSKSTTPDDEQDDIDEETRESLEYCAERYDGAVGAAAEMLLQSSPEGSNE